MKVLSTMQREGEKSQDAIRFESRGRRIEDVQARTGEDRKQGRRRRAGMR